MDKHEILEAIRRTADANGGKPLGSSRFRDATQIQESDWFGRYWKNWGEALSEAGFRPNTMQIAYEEDTLLTALADLIREIHAFPVKADLMMKRRRDASFPSHNVFRRFGTKAQCATRLLEYCRAKGDCSGVEEILVRAASGRRVLKRDEISTTEAVPEFVYLVRHGSRREFKIGRTKNPLRREGEIAIELPERIKPIHVIETDDAPGVERYWHQRFAEKRKGGEWFELSADDVRAFKRWRRIF